MREIERKVGVFPSLKLKKAYPAKLILTCRKIISKHMHDTNNKINETNATTRPPIQNQ